MFSSGTMHATSIVGIESVMLLVYKCIYCCAELNNNGLDKFLKGLNGCLTWFVIHWVQ